MRKEPLWRKLSCRACQFRAMINVNFHFTKTQLRGYTIAPFARSSSPDWKSNKSHRQTYCISFVKSGIMKYYLLIPASCVYCWRRRLRRTTKQKWFYHAYPLIKFVRSGCSVEFKWISGLGMPVQPASLTSFTVVGPIRLHGLHVNIFMSGNGPLAERCVVYISVYFAFMQIKFVQLRSRFNERETNYTLI